MTMDEEREISGTGVETSTERACRKWEDGDARARRGRRRRGDAEGGRGRGRRDGW